MNRPRFGGVGRCLYTLGQARSGFDKLWHDIGTRHGAKISNLVPHLLHFARIGVAFIIPRKRPECDRFEGFRHTHGAGTYVIVRFSALRNDTSELSNRCSNITAGMDFGSIPMRRPAPQSIRMRRPSMAAKYCPTSSAFGVRCGRTGASWPNSTKRGRIQTAGIHGNCPNMGPTGTVQAIWGRLSKGSEPTCAQKPSACVVACVGRKRCGGHGWVRGRGGSRAIQVPSGPQCKGECSEIPPTS